LCSAAIDAPQVHYLVAYGVSNNPRSCGHSAAMQLLGYVPQDSARSSPPKLLSRNDQVDPVLRAVQAGRLAPPSSTATHR